MALCCFRCFLCSTPSHFRSSFLFLVLRIHCVFYESIPSLTSMRDNFSWKRTAKLQVRHPLKNTITYFLVTMIFVDKMFWSDDETCTYYIESYGAEDPTFESQCGCRKREDGLQFCSCVRINGRTRILSTNSGITIIVIDAIDCSEQVHTSLMYLKQCPVDPDFSNNICYIVYFLECF